MVELTHGDGSLVRGRAEQDLDTVALRERGQPLQQILLERGRHRRRHREHDARDHAGRVGADALIAAATLRRGERLDLGGQPEHVGGTAQAGHIEEQDEPLRRERRGCGRRLHRLGEWPAADGASSERRRVGAGQRRQISGRGPRVAGPPPPHPHTPPITLTTHSPMCVRE